MHSVFVMICSLQFPVVGCAGIMLTDLPQLANAKVTLSDIDKQISIISKLDSMDFTVMSARSSVAFLNCSFLAMTGDKIQDHHKI